MTIFLMEVTSDTYFHFIHPMLILHTIKDIIKMNVIVSFDGSRRHLTVRRLTLQAMKSPTTTICMFQVQTTDDMWRYIEHSFVPSLIHDSTRYTADNANIVVGIARIRQLRVVVGRFSRFVYRQQDLERERIFIYIYFINK